MDDFNLKFQGFHPSSFARSYMADRFSILHEEAPYGSHVQATISRRDHLFKGVVTIYSSAGKFFATASASRLRDVTQKLIDQIRKQLDRWKTRRFQVATRHKSQFHRSPGASYGNTNEVA